MNSERWQQLNEVLEAALERTPGHHAAFLDEAAPVTSHGVGSTEDARPLRVQLAFP